MKRIARVAKVEDQDRIRREDCLRLTPSERVEALLEWRSRYFGERMQPLVRTARILRLGPDCDHS